MATVQHSACPLNCWDSCGFLVTVEDGKVTKVEGNPEHPITQGKICGRGRMLENRANSEDRLLYPLKKIEGRFQQISWEQALGEIAEKLAYYKDNFGTISVLHSHDYSNSGLLSNLDSRFFNLYGGVTELTGSICWGSGIEAQNWDFGDAYSHAPEDLENSKHVVIWGRNVARTNMHLFQNLQAVKKNGTKIYVIDPIYNATAKLANEYISIKPGFDGLLAAGIMKELLRMELQDVEFLANQTVGFEDLKTLLDSVTLEYISQVTEVPAEIITLLAGVYADRPVSTIMGLGMQRYENGGNTIRLLDALVAVSGNIGIAGGGANYANKQVGQSFDYQNMAMPEQKKASRTFTMMRQAEGILTAVDPEIKMGIVTCGNPLTQVPDTNRVRKAFESLETLVVIDQFMTDTAELADYVLPAATAFEVEDVYYSSMYHHYVNHGPKLVEPPGEAKPDAWIWEELATRLGFGDEFNFTREEFIGMGLAALTEKGISLDKIRVEKFAELPVDKIPWADRSFKTPSGKYEFTSSAVADGKIKLSLPTETKWTNSELAEKYPYTLLTIHPLRSNHSQHFHLFQPEPYVKVEIAESVAAEKGLKDQDYVRVWNDRGEVKGTVSIFKMAHPGTVNIDEGLSARFGGSVNQLTSSRESDNGLGSTLYDCLVNIEKVEKG
ncbi:MULTISPECIES: molybdopterin-dependent oxidoreductase [unclassified Mesobacillus]|uniref:molybdopterin-dependent oxidoreductase n=1 Tax=unclassified Mesobacillus TaxID=2675270 RepID=UPI00203BB840|nr:MULTISPECIES: molybdopterin-dependent oxidoreductase [unclassified Mesobacillus]MCM3123593.1 molybdopterin-dependent oxidoreductase [Mesobacillus sp. MER 33]MCM3234392.1 molybdopterin-dependent oxidoreductase [Mesobacillus sp. MER 48]